MPAARLSACLLAVMFSNGGGAVIGDAPFSRRAPFAPLERDVTEADLAAGALQPYLVDLAADHDTRLRWVKLRSGDVTPPRYHYYYCWINELRSERRKKAGSALGALLAALRHSQESGQHLAGTDGTSCAAAIEYLEGRLGAPAGGTWEEALSPL